MRLSLKFAPHACRSVIFPCGSAQSALKAIPMTAEAKTVQADQAVALHYVLKDDDGTVIDQSSGDEPLYYLHGHDNIVPGLEKALTGAGVGDKKQVVVTPAEGYGEHEEERIIEVPRDQLPGDMELEIGLVLAMETNDDEQIPVRVIEMHEDHVKMDANHELAGVTLHFEVTSDTIRPATAEELEHGHVHGPGAHHH